MAETREHPDPARMWQLLRDQQRTLELQAEELAEHRALLQALQSTTPDHAGDAAGHPGGRRTRRQVLSRAALVRGAAAGVAGLAAAELTGSLGATLASATTTDTSFIATGGSLTGIEVGGQTATDYNYGYGGVFIGRNDAVQGFARDSNGQPNGGNGVVGDTGSGTGVFGYAVSGEGVRGESNINIGVAGSAQVSGTGVDGYSAGTGYGVHGNAVSGIGGYFEGGQAALKLKPTAAVGPPTDVNHSQGEIVVDSNTNSYICIGSLPLFGTSLWQAIGNLRSFSSPARVFGQAVVAGSTYGPVDATHRRNGNPSGVPIGAVAMYAAVQSDQPGRLTLYPDGTTDPGIANWTNNGTPGSLFLTYMLIPLPTTAAFRIHSYITGNVYVDAWGYLL